MLLESLLERIEWMVRNFLLLAEDSRLIVAIFHLLVVYFEIVFYLLHLIKPFIAAAEELV
jgi:hypothetical protein